jgi:hypothetical protein
VRMGLRGLRAETQTRISRIKRRNQKIFLKK